MQYFNCQLTTYKVQMEVHKDDNLHEKSSSPSSTTSLISADKEDDDPLSIHPALTNPLILSRIFDMLTPSELKKCRRICKSWNEIGSNVLGKMTHLNVKAALENYLNSGESNLNVQPQLLRKVEIAQDLSHDNQIFCIILELFEDFIQEITFLVDWTFAPTMQSIFDTRKFPKLSKISLQIYCLKQWADCLDKYKYSEIFCPTRFGVLDKIKILEIDARLAEEPGRADAYLATFQEFINKSPNLEEVKIFGNLYPDLSSCSKLKSLAWRGFPLKEADYVVTEEDDEDATLLDFRPDFDLRKVWRMISQVDKGLKELVLGTCFTQLDPEGIELQRIFFEAIGDDVTTFDLPYLPKLTSLIIDPVNGLATHPLDNFCQNHLPCLKTLKLTENPLNDGGFYLVRLLQDQMAAPWATVESLCLYPIQYKWEAGIEELQNIFRWFPNLNTFHVAMRWEEYDATDDDRAVMKAENLTHFQGWLKELGKCSWKLDDLILCIDCNVTLSQLMEGITGGAGFSGLKHLQLVSPVPLAVPDDECTCFEAALLSVPSITFVGFLFTGPTLSRMLKFIEKHDLKIYFDTPSFQ